MSTFVLKRKTFSDEKEGMSTGKKLALGTAGTLATAGLAFAGAKTGKLGVGLQKSANKAWASGGQLLGNQKMVNSGKTGFTKAIGKENNLNARDMVGVRNNITNAANSGNEQFKAFKDIASK